MNYNQTAENDNSYQSLNDINTNMVNVDNDGHENKGIFIYLFCLR